MNKLFLIISKFFFYLTNIVIFIFFGIPIVIYLKLPFGINLNFFSIFDIFLKISIIYEKIFFNKSKNEIFKKERDDFLKLLLITQKKTIIFFCCKNIEDFYLIFLFFNGNFFYFKFLDEKNYPFFMNFFIKKMNQMYLNEKKLNIFNFETEVFFYLKEESLSFFKINLENYNYFYVKKENIFNNEYLLLLDKEDNILISYEKH